MTLPRAMIVIDYETNGAKIPGTTKMDLHAQVPVEVCAVRVVEGEITSVFNSLVYYDGEWTQALENGHHSREDILKGLDERTICEIIWQMVMGDEIFVAYNALFDAVVTYNMFKRYLHGDAEQFPSAVQILDPLTIARDRHQGSHKLVDACTRYGIDLPGAHMAYDDVMGLVDLVKALDKEADISSYVNVIGYKSQYGLPEWYPPHVMLKPQGSETIYHRADGTVQKQSHTGRPFQPTVMGKPVPLVRPKP